MVQLRPRCWGPAAVGPARLILPSDLEEERHAIPDNITVHVRVPITEDGDFFESYIPWDVTDAALKDADTFAVALGNDFGLSLEAVEEIARDISAQLKHMADVNPQVLQLMYLPHEAQLEAEAIQKAAEAEAAARRQQLLDLETARQSATDRDATAERQHEKEPGLYGYGPPPTGPTVPQAPAVGVDMWGHAPYQHHYFQQQQQQPVGPVVQVDHGRKRKLGADGTAGEHGGTRGRDADPVVDGLLNDMPAELMLVLTALSQESKRVLRAMRINLQKCSGTCHDCRHTSEATLVCCPKDLLSHGLCTLHFERRHGLTHDQALAMASQIKDPPDANTPVAVPDNFPVCILCGMRCECRSCRRTHMRRVLDVIRRAVNLQAGLTEDEDHANLLSLPTPTTLSVPHSLLQDDVRRCLGGSGDPQTYGRKTGRPRKFESHVALPDKVYGFSPLHLENVSPSTITTALTYNRKSVTRKPRPDELMLMASQSAPVDADGPPPPPIILDAAAAGLSVADFGRGPADDISSSTAGQTSMLSAITGLAEDDEGQGGKSHRHKRVKVSHGKAGVDGEQSPKAKPPRGKVFYKPPAKKGKGGRPSKAKSAEQPVEYPNVNLEVCVACLKENDEELVDCHQCPRAYHAKCARLKADENKDEWLCDFCADDIDEPHASIISDTAESFRNAEKDCRAVLKVLMEHDLSGAFCEAVDLDLAPGYLDIISKPTHLGEIKETFFGTSAGRKAAKNAKFPVADFILAVRRVWLNCQTYNEEGSVLYNIGDLLSQIFEANVEARLERHMDDPERQELKGQTQAMEAEAEEILTAVFVVPNGKSAKGKRASSPAALPSSAPPTATTMTTTTGERKRPGRNRKRQKQQTEKQGEQKEGREKGPATAADAADEVKREEEEQEQEDEEVDLKVKQEDGVEQDVKEKQPPPAKKTTKSKAARVKKEEDADDDETESEGEPPTRAIPPKKTGKTGKRSEKKHAKDADATHQADEGGAGEEDDGSESDIPAESQLKMVEGPRMRRPSQRAAEAAEVAAPPPGKKRSTPGRKISSTGAEAGSGKAKGKDKAKATTPVKKKEAIGSPPGKAEKAEVITKSGRRSRGTG